MKLFKMKELTTPHAVIITGILISLSIFITASVFLNKPNQIRAPFPPNNPSQLRGAPQIPERQPTQGSRNMQIKTATSTNEISQ